MAPREDAFYLGEHPGRVDQTKFAPDAALHISGIRAIPVEEHVDPGRHPLSEKLLVGLHGFNPLSCSGAVEVARRIRQRFRAPCIFSRCFVFDTSRL